MSKYLVFQVGCIECGVSSYPVSTHDTLADAQAAAESHPDTWESEGGEGYVIIIDFDACQEIGDD